MSSIHTIATIFVLAVLVEGTVEYLGNPIPALFKPYVAALLAILVCLAYGADLPSALGLPSVPVAGPVVTGLVIGRGSNYLADILRRIQTVSAPAQSVASVPQPDEVGPRPPL